jgi:proline racemase
VENAQVGGRAAVVPTLSGRAWISGFTTLVLDPEDPLPIGYTLGDIWP